MSAGGFGAERVQGWFQGGLILVLIELGRRVGVLEVMGSRRWRSTELAAAAGVHERYLLEWLCAMAAFGVVALEIDEGGGETWRLDPELGPCLASNGANAHTRLATTVVGAAHQMVRLVDSFEHGGGLPYSDQDANLNAAFDADARENYGRRLLKGVIPAVPGINERLLDGAVVADLGCGAAYGLETLARAFPRSRFIGFDADERTIGAGRERLRGRGIENVLLEAAAIEDLPAAGAYDVVCAFEVIHNLPHPSTALKRARELLVSGGTFFMYETNASSIRAADIGLPWAGPVYTASLLSCVTVSLAHNGVGYGAMWGVRTATSVMEESGFDGVGHHEVIDDPMHVVIWGTRR